MNRSIKTIILLSATLYLPILFSSCSIITPSFSRTRIISERTINNNAAQIEALKREDYTILGTTTGKASTSRFYILFFPIGKHKSNVELYDNAYNDAVDNLTNADALILPRQQTKRFTIPLILFNYNRRTVTVTGAGISVKDKIIESTDMDVPHFIAKNYTLKQNFDIKQSKKHKITTQSEFEKIFEKTNLTDTIDNHTNIDFSKQYAVVIIGNNSNKSQVISVNYLRYKNSKITLAYTIEKGEKQKEKTRPFLILIVDKKYQGEITLNKKG